METTIEQLQVQVINVDREEICISFGIKAGFVQKYYANFSHDDLKKITINSASAAVFSFYLQQQYHLKTGKMLASKAYDNVLSVTAQTTINDFDSDLKALTEVFFNEKVEDYAIQTAINAFIRWFKKEYKHVTFRSRLNMLEFSHQMKDYRMMKLLHDIEHYTVEDFRYFKEKMIGFANTSVLIVGREEDLKNQTSFFKGDFIQNRRLISSLFPVKAVLDPFMITDQRRVKHDIEYYEEGCIRFDRLDSRFSNNEMYALLQVIGRILFKKHFEVNVDAFDASIIYRNHILKEYKTNLQASLTDERIEEAVQSFQSELKYVLLEHPVLFNQYFQQLEINNISYLDIYFQIANITKEAIEMALPYLKISECHLETKRKGARVYGR